MNYDRFEFLKADLSISRVALWIDVDLILFLILRIELKSKFSHSY